MKNLALSVSQYHGQLSSRTISEKNIYPILRNLVTERRTNRQTDRQTDRQTERQQKDRQTDESDFIVHCLTNVERPKTFKIKFKKG